MFSENDLCDILNNDSSDTDTYEINTFLTEGQDGELRRNIGVLHTLQSPIISPSKSEASPMSSSSGLVSTESDDDTSENRVPQIVLYQHGDTSSETESQSDEPEDEPSAQLGMSDEAIGRRIDNLPTKDSQDTSPLGLATEVMNAIDILWGINNFSSGKDDIKGGVVSSEILKSTVDLEDFLSILARIDATCPQSELRNHQYKIYFWCMKILNTWMRLPRRKDKEFLRHRVKRIIINMEELILSLGGTNSTEVKENHFHLPDSHDPDARLYNAEMIDVLGTFDIRNYYLYMGTDSATGKDCFARIADDERDPQYPDLPLLIDGDYVHFTPDAFAYLLERGRIRLSQEREGHVFRENLATKAPNHVVNTFTTTMIPFQEECVSNNILYSQRLPTDISIDCSITPNRLGSSPVAQSVGTPIQLSAHETTQSITGHGNFRFVLEYVSDFEICLLSKRDLAALFGDHGKTSFEINMFAHSKEDVNLPMTIMLDSGSSASVTGNHKVAALLTQVVGSDRPFYSANRAIVRAALVGRLHLVNGEGVLISLVVYFVPDIGNKLLVSSDDLARQGWDITFSTSPRCRITNSAGNSIGVYYGETNVPLLKLFFVSHKRGRDGEADANDANKVFKRNVTQTDTTTTYPSLIPNSELKKTSDVTLSLEDKEGVVLLEPKFRVGDLVKAPINAWPKNEKSNLLSTPFYHGVIKKVCKTFHKNEYSYKVFFYFDNCLAQCRESILSPGDPDYIPQSRHKLLQLQRQQNGKTIVPNPASPLQGGEKEEKDKISINPTKVPVTNTTAADTATDTTQLKPNEATTTTIKGGEITTNQNTARQHKSNEASTKENNNIQSTTTVTNQDKQTNEVINEELEFNKVPEKAVDESVKIQETAQVIQFHKRYCHLNFEELKELMRRTHNIKLQCKHEYLCENCLACKATKQFKETPVNYGRWPFQVVSADVVGPINPCSRANYNHFISIICHYSNWVCTYVSKAPTSLSIITSIQKTEAQMGYKIERFHCDGASYFASNELNDYCIKNKITLTFSSPYKPNEQAKIERNNRSNIEGIRTMIHAAKAPLYLWPYCLFHLNYVKNRINSRHGLPSPYEMIYGKPCDLSNLRPWGCTAFYKVPRDTTLEEHSKFDPIAKTAMFIGMGKNGMARGAYLLASLRNSGNTMSIRYSRDVRFNEEEYYFDRIKKGSDTDIEINEDSNLTNEVVPSDFLATTDDPNLSTKEINLLTTEIPVITKDEENIVPDNFNEAEFVSLCNALEDALDLSAPKNDKDIDKLPEEEKIAWRQSQDKEWIDNCMKTVLEPVHISTVTDKKKILPCRFIYKIKPGVAPFTGEWNFHTNFTST